MMFADSERHVDSVRHPQPVDSLQQEGERELLLELDDNRTLVATHGHDVARPNLTFHLIALGFEEPLDRTVQIGFRHTESRRLD